MTQQAIRKADVIILGQGLAGSAMAWRLHWAGQRVFLIDRGESVTASRVAAGLITPITGRRMTKHAEFDTQQCQAELFYREVETITGQQFLEKRPCVRFFISAEERELFVTERWPHHQGDVRLIHNEAREVTGFEMLTAARLQVIPFLDATRNFFKERNEYVTADVDLSSDIQLANEGVHIPKLNRCAQRLVFCQGYQPLNSPWFPGVPDGASKGEILIVRLKGRSDQRVTHHGHWLAPGQSGVTVTADAQEITAKRDEIFIVGATYDRDDLSHVTTTAAREELLAGLAGFVSEPVEVLGQVAAVRAGMKDRRPVFSVHPHHPELSILNGLGSRGALLAPNIARELTTLLLGGTPPQPGKATRKSSLTQVAHNIIRRVLKPGDTAIDATAGNGHDTLFLAQLVGETGSVLAIDVQPHAIAVTQQSLSQHGIRHASYRLTNHATELSRLAAEQFCAKAIMFNLGYLPGSNRTITTVAESTLAALQSAQKLLSPGGVITVIAYRGHVGGKEEAAAIEDLIIRPSSAGFDVDRISGDEDNDTSPVLFVWRRT